MFPAMVPNADAQVAPAEAARIAAVLRAALSRATIEVYTLRLETYAAWARSTGRPWRHTLTLLAFLSGPASRRSDAWRQQLIAALRYACREAETQDLTRDPAIAQAMRGLRRQRPQKPAQVSGLTSEVIAKIEATACAPRRGRGRGHCMESPEAATRRGHVDIALVRTMRDGLLRRSEAAALRWQDLSAESDGSGRLHITRSKTDQEARGHVAYLTPATTACLQRIRPTDAQPEKRIFPMSARTIANRIKAAARAATKGRFAGHSGRVRCAQDLAARGAGPHRAPGRRTLELRRHAGAVCTQPAGWAGAPSRSTSRSCQPLRALSTPCVRVPVVGVSISAKAQRIALKPPSWAHMARLAVGAHVRIAANGA